MKEFLKNLYKYLYQEDLVKTIEVCPVPPTPPKTNREKLIDIAKTYYGTDPTPKDEQPDDVACVHSLTTIIKVLFKDFPVMTYTPTLFDYLKKDNRFRQTTEWKEGNIIISVTNTGNGTIIGHTGIIGSNGKIFSNSSETGLWLDKFDTISWLDRYSRKGQLALYLFEVI